MCSLICTNQHIFQALCRKFAPLGDRILVRRAAKEVQTASGIYLPNMGSKDPNEGEVVAVGPGERDVTGTLHVPNLKAGDKVLLPEYGGMKITFDKEENMVLFRESDILGKFD
jgi:chaperonin GroES